jgi:hypothetical protein
MLHHVRRQTMDDDRRDFGRVTRDLMLERGGECVTPLGNPNWRWLASQLVDVSYESLRKALTGERVPGSKIMEAVAAHFNVEPAATFWEYRAAALARSFDAHDVGPDAAYQALTAYEAGQSRARNRRRSR